MESHRFNERIAFRLKRKDKQILNELKELKSTTYSQVVRELLVTYLNSIKEKVKTSKPTTK